MDEKNNVIDLPTREERPECTCPDVVSPATHEDVESLRQTVSEMAGVLKESHAQNARAALVNARVTSLVSIVLSISLGALAVWNLTLSRRIKGLEALRIAP